MDVPNADNLIELARERLEHYRPLTIDLNGWKPAAVLLLLYYKAGAEHIVLTMRTDRVEHHKGQISFPGGAVHEADADLETTALRETYEEIGIDPSAVEVLGRLDEMVTVSDFRVTPVVAVLHGGPYEFIPSPDEVAEVLEVPLSQLLDPANFVEEWRERAGSRVAAPAYRYEGWRIWGATARMLHGFLELLEADAAPPAGKEQAD